jgi:hypothetical protein
MYKSSKGLIIKEVTDGFSCFSCVFLSFWKQIFKLNQLSFSNMKFPSVIDLF